MAKVHQSADRRGPDLFHRNGDGIPTLGQDKGAVESVGIVLSAFGVAGVVDPAGDGKKLFGRIKGTELKLGKPVPVFRKVLQTDA